MSKSNVEKLVVAESLWRRMLQADRQAAWLLAYHLTHVEVEPESESSAPRNDKHNP